MKDLCNKLVIGGIGNDVVVDYFSNKISESIDNGENLFILDRNHKYLNKINDKLLENKYKIINVDLKNLVESDCFNPYIIPYKLYKSGNIDAAIELIKSVNGAMIITNTSTDPFWENSACDIFNACTLYLFDNEEKEENVTLSNIYRVLSKANDDIKAFKKIMDESKEYISLNANCFVNAPIETRGSIYSVCVQKVNLYLSQPAFSNFLSKTSFDLIKEFDSKVAIIVNAIEGKSYKNIVVNILIEDIFYCNKEDKIITLFIEDITDLRYITVLYNILKKTYNNIKVVMSSTNKEIFENMYANYAELVEIIEY